METRNYKILGVSVKINCNLRKILYLLDNAYCSFIDEKIADSPMLELVVDSKNGDINDLSNMHIHAITPSSFDGWERASKAWMGANSNVKRFVSQVDSLPGSSRSANGSKFFKINTITDIPGVENSCLRNLYFFINLFALDCSEKALYIIHGGALASGDRGLILTGSPGSGKSTLTYALAKAGLSYLTDECVLFNTEKYCLLPYPISPSFEEDTARLFDEVEQSYLEDRKLHNENIKSFVNISKLGIKTAKGHIEPKVIIFPKYIADQKPQLKELSKAKAAELLDEQTSFFQESAKKDINKSDVIDLLINKCKCYELVSNELDETVALVKQALSS